MTAAVDAPGAGIAAPPPSMPLRSRLLRNWRAGLWDAVEADLSSHAETAEWRTALVGLRFARALRHDATARPAPVAPREQDLVLKALLDFGALAAARAYAALMAADPQPLESNLATLVRWAPPTPPGQSDDEFADDPTADVQVVRRPDAGTVIFAFTGGAQTFNGPLGLIHQWFRRLNAHIVYLRDFDGMFFAGGIRSLGPGHAEAVAGLSGIAATLGATRILCAGSSSGTFGALRCGLHLGAAGVLCLAGPSRLDDSVPRILERQRRRRPDATPIDPGGLDLAPAYAAAARHPRIRIVFGEDNETDRLEAENMAALAGCELDPLPGFDRHNVLPGIVPDGGFERRLAWLAATEAVAAAPRA